MSTLTGRVTVDGSPVPTAVIEVHNSQGDVVDQVQADEDGRYKYHLSPGDWTLNVWDEQGHRARKGVTIAEDDTSMDIELAPGK